MEVLWRKIRQKGVFLRCKLNVNQVSRFFFKTNEDGIKVKFDPFLDLPLRQEYWFSGFYCSHSLRLAGQPKPRRQNPVKTQWRHHPDLALLFHMQILFQRFFFFHQQCNWQWWPYFIGSRFICHEKFPWATSDPRILG